MPTVTVTPGTKQSYFKSRVLSLPQLEGTACCAGQLPAADGEGFGLSASFCLPLNKKKSFFEMNFLTLLCNFWVFSSWPGNP